MRGEALGELDLGNLVVVVEPEINQFHRGDVRQDDAGLLPFADLLLVEFENLLAVGVQFLGEGANEFIAFFLGLEEAGFQFAVDIPASLPRAFSIRLIVWNDAHSRLRQS